MEKRPGTVISVRGSVIDARLPQPLPELHNEMRAGYDDEIVIEVAAHLNAETVRGIALTPTRGLAHGAAVSDSGHPLQVPVGRRLLGRMFNVIGQTIDGHDAIRDGEWRSIHRPPIAL